MPLAHNTEEDQQAQRQVKECLDRQSQAAANLRLNALVPVNSLPPELLSEIFHLCQKGLTLPGDWTAYGKTGNVLRWIAVTWVCHY